MLNNSRVYPYKINDMHKTPYKNGAVRSDIGQTRKAGSVSVQCYNEPERCDIQPISKKVSFDQNIYVRLIHNREEYDKHMIRQLWWTKHELADLRKEGYAVETKPEVSFLDFLFKICDWKIDFDPDPRL
jgi:hypothetical protein